MGTLVLLKINDKEEGRPSALGMVCMGKANCSMVMGKPEVVFALSLEMTGGLQPETQLRKGKS